MIELAEKVKVLTGSRVELIDRTLPTYGPKKRQPDIPLLPGLYGLFGLFGVVNRCVDLLGQEDCLMVELRREQGQ